MFVVVMNAWPTASVSARSRSDLIKLCKDIVQQKYRPLVAFVLKIEKLRHFEGYQKRFMLSL